MLQKFTLTENDFKNIVTWFELAFGKNNKQSISDEHTFKKFHTILSKRSLK